MDLTAFFTALLGVFNAGAVADLIGGMAVAVGTVMLISVGFRLLSRFTRRSSKLKGGV